jgi:hypothetical protein
VSGALAARVGRAEQSLAADGAIACFSSNFFHFSLNADRAPQLKASVMLLLVTLKSCHFFSDSSSFVHWSPCTRILRLWGGSSLILPQMKHGQSSMNTAASHLRRKNFALGILLFSCGKWGPHMRLSLLELVVIAVKVKLNREPVASRNISLNRAASKPVESSQLMPAMNRSGASSCTWHLRELRRLV